MYRHIASTGMKGNLHLQTVTFVAAINEIWGNVTIAFK